MNLKRLIYIALSLFVSFNTAYSEDDSIWELEAVDTHGLGTHPKVGADPGMNPESSSNRVSIVGIALNRSDELVDPDSMWQVYVQAQPPNQGGIAVWAATFYNPQWPRYPDSIEPGDLIRVEGFVMNARGKINLNERHSAAPGMQFFVMKLGFVGMPEPLVITRLGQCNFFDSTREVGGERYQGQWVKLEGVELLEGEVWESGATVVVRDDEGSTLPLLLSERDEFLSQEAPIGKFSVVGIFDQEDGSAPFTENYRLWVKHPDAVILSENAANKWMLME